MKKVLFGMLVLGAMVSCKKDKKASCESTVAGITGSYKLTKLVLKANGIPDQDQTATGLGDCEKNGLYVLKADKTVTYTETGTCSDSGVGNWDIVNDKITITTDGGSLDFSAQPLTSWDCTTFVITEDLGAAGANANYYFTKQ